MPAILNTTTAPVIPQTPAQVQPPVAAPPPPGAAPPPDGFTVAEQNAGVVQTEAAAAVRPAAEELADPKTPPSLTGTLVMENGKPWLESAAGKFELVNIANGGDSLHFFSASDVQAFAGRVVTVRGWPTDGWLPGQTGGVLAVEEWAPGKSADFVAGRLMVKGEDVSVRVRADKLVAIDDPALKALLKSYDNLGIVLPGAVEKQGDAWRFTATPADYYVLSGFSAMWGATPTPVDGKYTFSMQLAHGKTVSTEVPATEWEKTARGQRHYFFGHFEPGKFVAKGFTPSAGPWVTSGTAVTPNPAYRTTVTAAAGKPIEGDAKFEW